MNQFRKSAIFVPLLLMGILLTGCPYESAVPVTEKGSEFPANFIGKWVNMKDFSPFEQMTYYELLTKDKKQFTLTKYEFSTSEEKYEATVYKGHFSTVNGTLFMNLVFVPDEPSSFFGSGEGDAPVYIIYRVRPYKDYIVLDGLSTNITETFTTSNELKSYIEKHMKNELFYNNGEETVLTFMKKP